jgi:adenylate kinase family enzyme
MRILIVGTSGAGKSRFARTLAEKTGVPCVELDRLHWGPNWTPKDTCEFRRLTAEATAGEAWIVEGNYSVIRDLVWSRATTVIWLNFGFTIVLYRSISRTVRRIWTGEPLWHGNRESFRRSFLSGESVLVWMITTFHRRRRSFTELRASGTYPHLTWIEFRRPRDAKRYLESL